MIAFEVLGGASRAEAAANSTRLIVHATSLGGIESSMERRAKWSGDDSAPSLLRLSVGCEDVEDLWSDLQRCLDISGEVRGGLGTALNQENCRPANRDA